MVVVVQQMVVLQQVDLVVAAHLVLEQLEMLVDIIH